MMPEPAWNLRFGAQVHATDGTFGTAPRIMVHVSSRKVTGVVVHQSGFLGIELLVPVELIEAATSKSISFRLTHTQLEAQPMASEYEYLDSSDGDIETSAAYPAAPSLMPIGPIPAELEHERIAPGDVSMDQHTVVEASDGRLGKLAALAVDPATHGITGIVVREWHHLHHIEVVIPMTAVDRLADDAIYLSWTKQKVASLPVA